jgi:hypothetical protein
MVHRANINVKFISFFTIQINSHKSHVKNGLSQKSPTDFKENRNLKEPIARQPKILANVSIISSFWVRIPFLGAKMGKIETNWIFLKPLKQVF